MANLEHKTSKTSKTSKKAIAEAINTVRAHMEDDPAASLLSVFQQTTRHGGDAVDNALRKAVDLLIARVDMATDCTVIKHREVRTWFRVHSLLDPINVQEQAKTLSVAEFFDGQENEDWTWLHENVLLSAERPLCQCTLQAGRAFAPARRGTENT
jgi:fructose/tagatose bisphosphate aldolase